jgi:serpin B
MGSPQGPRRPQLGISIALVAAIVTACTGASPSPSDPGPSASVSPSDSPSTRPSTEATPSLTPLEGITLAKSDVPRADASAADARAGAAAINAFGFDLYERVAEPGKNAVFSPASIVLALGMARTGARGETATEMDAVLHGAAADDHPGWLNALERELSDRDQTFPVQEGEEGEPARLTLRIANAQFAQVGMGLEPAFLDALASRFGAGLRQVDYMNDPEAARQVINAWVGQQTEGRIPELLMPLDVKTSTRLALVNAIYLKAPWAVPFVVEATVDGPFTRVDGTRVSVPMMHALSSPGTQRAAVTEGWQAVELPYRGGTLSMLLIVPGDLEAFEAELGPESLAEIDAALDEKHVDLTMPRFGIEARASLGDALIAMGMPLAFDPERADFYGISRDVRRLYIERVIHQANIDVDEKGTEAAAATAVLMGDTSGGSDEAPLIIRADRPFVFLLRDVPTGAILFTGRVADPSIER